MTDPKKRLRLGSDAEPMDSVFHNDARKKWITPSLTVWQAATETLAGVGSGSDASGRMTPA